MLALLVHSLSGCTLLGYSAGAMVDAGNKRVVVPDSLPVLQPGAQINVKLRDNTEMAGTYRGIEPLPADEYADRYTRYRAEVMHRVSLPALHDTVLVALVAGEDRRGRFLGFDPGAVVVESTGATVTVSLWAVDRLSAVNGSTIDGENLILLSEQGTTPLRSALSLELSPPAGGTPTAERQVISLDRIAFIERKSHTGRRVGMIVGGVIDAAALIALMICASSESSGFSAC
jgi:hypothetical protein